MPYNLMPFEVLQPALACDPAALLQIVKHYDAYINRLAERPILGSDGMVYLCTDEDMKQDLVLELLTKIPRFRIPDEQGASS